MNSNSKIFYRVEETFYSAPADEFGDSRGEGSVSVKLYAFPVVRETPKGVWILAFSYERFILLTARKRYACPTVQEAEESFLARKNREISLYKARAKRVERAVAEFHAQKENFLLRSD